MISNHCRVSVKRTIWRYTMKGPLILRTKRKISPTHLLMYIFWGVRYLNQCYVIYGPVHKYLSEGSDKKKQNKKKNKTKQNRTKQNNNNNNNKTTKTTTATTTTKTTAATTTTTTANNRDNILGPPSDLTKKKAPLCHEIYGSTHRKSYNWN